MRLTTLPVPQVLPPGALPCPSCIVYPKPYLLMLRPQTRRSLALLTTLSVDLSPRSSHIVPSAKDISSSSPVPVLQLCLHMDHAEPYS